MHDYITTAAIIICLIYGNPQNYDIINPPDATNKTVRAQFLSLYGAEKISQMYKFNRFYLQDVSDHMVKLPSVTYQNLQNRKCYTCACTAFMTT